MIRIFAKQNARDHVSIMLKNHVGHKGFDSKSKAINYLEKELMFFGSEILECDFIDVESFENEEIIGRM